MRPSAAEGESAGGAIQHNLQSGGRCCPPGCWRPLVISGGRPLAASGGRPPNVTECAGAQEPQTKNTPSGGKKEEGRREGARNLRIFCFLLLLGLVLLARQLVYVSGLGASWVPVTSPASLCCCIDVEVSAINAELVCLLCPSL